MTKGEIVTCLGAMAIGVVTCIGSGLIVYEGGRRMFDASAQAMGVDLARAWDPIDSSLECHLREGNQYSEGGLVVQRYQVIGGRRLEEYDGRFYLRPEGSETVLGERGEMLREGEGYGWENGVFTATVEIMSINGGLMEIEWSGGCKERK